MKILILGGGGREHALAFRLMQDESCTSVTVIPGNPGMSKDGIAVADVSILDFDAISKFVSKNEVDLVIVGPEDPLSQGIVDYLREKEINVVGPSKHASQLESSKSYSKKIMSKYNIPTARYQCFKNVDAAIEGLFTFDEGEVVVKASSLAGGKGVVVANDYAEARRAIEDFLLNPKCSVKTDEIVLEQRLYGEEVSAFALFDENGYINLGYARDYKRVGDGDLGPNTGGMGTFSSNDLLNNRLKEKINKEVFDKILSGMKNEGTPFTGILFAGLMIDGENINVIEFNVRFGDPEAQSILPRLKGDLCLTFLNQSRNKLSKSVSFDSRSAVHVVMCSKNYPSIDGTQLDLGHTVRIGEQSEDTKVYYAGVKANGAELVNSGGRVLGVTALGRTVDEARQKSYGQISNIHFENAHYRKDIAVEN
jgi:phosphoribosylamine--glycine ligase